MRVFRWLALPAALLLLAATHYATAYPSRRTPNLAYVPATDPAYDAERHVLDVYSPRQPAATPYPVVVFIHGGSWNSGNKNFYSFIGRRLAKQGVVAVVVNYRLSPKVQVPAMADDCARAVVWVTEHIKEYGGDPQRLYLLGHSAGGGLAALLAADNRLFERRGLPRNPVRGVLLNDPAGLDMFTYLSKLEYPGDEAYLIPYGRQPAVWKEVSALYHVTAATAPFVVFIGGETYPSIRNSSRRFEQQLAGLGRAPQFTVLPGKKHAAMVLQLYWQNNIIYRKLLEFIGADAAARQ